MKDLESPQISEKIFSKTHIQPDVLPNNNHVAVATAEVHQSAIFSHNKSIARKRYRTRHELETLRKLARGKAGNLADLERKSTEEEIEPVEVWISLRQRAEEMFGCFLDRICETLDCHSEQIANYQRKAFARNQWSRVSLLLDRLFLICFIISTLTTGILMLGKPDLRQ